MRVTRVEDGEPVSGIGLKLLSWNSREIWFHQRAALTNGEGLAVYAGVPPGDATIYIERLSEPNSFGAESISIVAGEVAEVEFRVVTGHTIHGRVVDWTGRPVPDADIWLGDGGGPPNFGQIVTHSDENGEFEIPHTSSHQGIAARAAGYAPSLAFLPLFYCESGAAESFVELVLPDVGGAIEGEVVDTAGRPQSDALVLIGNADFGKHVSK